MLRAVIVLLMLGCGSKQPPPAAPVENVSEPAPATQPAPAPATHPAATTGACAAYAAMVQRYATCRSLPPQTRASLQQAMPQFQQMLAQLAQMQPEQRKAADDACAQAVSALRQSAQQLGCSI